MGTIAVGAMVLGSATGSASPIAHSAPVGVELATANDADVVDVVAAEPAVLRGFAPPAARSADTADAQFRLAADLPAGPLGIPGIVLQAYKLAATRVAAETPQCKLPWYLLAGIGRIESGHAGNGNVDAYGNTRTKIRGPVLDGSLAGNAVIKDSDGGKLDGDGGHDRAMGPMQFIPSTWASWGSDANGDGKADPDNVFDATYSAGRYLCAGVTDIMAAGTRVNAVLRYNRSVAYANNVLGWAAAYAAGVMPTTPIPEMGQDPADKKDKKKDDKDAKKDSKDRDPKSDKKDDKSASKTPTPPKTTKTPPPTCLGVICLPPGLGPQPNAPAPKKTQPKKATPSKSAQNKSSQKKQSAQSTSTRVPSAR